MTEWKKTWALRYFGLTRIPLLLVAWPTLIRMDETECEIKIPLTYWTKNHLDSMYFGALAMGADCAGGLMAMDRIRKTGKKISLIFKDFQAEYLKRAEDDVHFVCRDGALIRKMVEETMKTGRRVNETLTVIATTPKKTGAEPVARFKLTLSLKLQVD